MLAWEDDSERHPLAQPARGGAGEADREEGEAKGGLPQDALDDSTRRAAAASQARECN